MSPAMLLLTESEPLTKFMSSESSVVPGPSQGPGPQSMTPGPPCHDFPNSPSVPPPVPHLLQQAREPCPPQQGPQSGALTQQRHQWDVNDSALPSPTVHDPFELWPSGHCRRVYRGDNDDARRHVSGWAMRNTNNHNALILKKSCLGVLVCSRDCLLDSGRKVHLRPAICDKARRKQIGKTCPNPGCSGKLELLSCRGHCGYPVTHFWRHLNNSVYFQAKGYHDHPRPEVKSLSEKGRHALSKQLSQDGGRFRSLATKRRFPILTTDDIADRKIFIPTEDEVMCSCPPFECVCPKSLSHPKLRPSSFGFIKESPPHTFLSHRSPPHSGAGMDPPLAHGPFTQINITNTCLPPPSLDVSIPGIEIYKNCSKFGHHNHHYYDTEMKMFRHGTGDEVHNTLAQNQNRNRGSGDDFTIFTTPNAASLQSVSCASRTFSSVNSSMAMSSGTSDVRDCLAKYRTCIGQYFDKSRATPTSMGERPQFLGQPLKSEPGKGVFMTDSSSPLQDPCHSYPSEPCYDQVSPPPFTAPPLQPSRLVECHTKSELVPDEINKEQEKDEGLQEPTYITLTPSSRRSVDGSQNQRELYSCRLGHMNRSPNDVPSSLDSFLYSPPASQPTRVESMGTPPAAPNIPRHQGGGRDSTMSCSPPVQSRRLSPGMPHLIFGENDIMGAPGDPSRSSALHPPPSSQHDSPMVPFPLNNDIHMPSYPPGMTGFGNNTNVPYGYYCNDMFQSPAHQAYRNRSINITLTYN